MKFIFQWKKKKKKKNEGEIHLQQNKNIKINREYTFEQSKNKSERKILETNFSKSYVCQDFQVEIFQFFN